MSTSVYSMFIEQFYLTKEQVISWFVYDPKNPLIFSSSLFLGMFVVFYLVYILTQKHHYFRTVYVLLFSLFFYYKAGGNYFVLLIVSSVLDYFFANQIHKSNSNATRKTYLILSIITNLGFLGYFKYTNFAIDSFNQIFGGSIALQDIVLPVGISFYTFQTMSYTIDIYRREITPAKSLLDFAFFVSFFPQLVAGPIVRAKDFIPQIYKKLSLTSKEASLALFLIIGGLLKKAVISDYISVNFVDRVFDSPNNYSSFENLMAVYGYTLQIYCDFSGYSDIAIGLALLMGFRLPENFRTPYKSQNITEFWRRWHISLSSWLRDYLYISVGGNRKPTFWGCFFPIVFFLGAFGWSIHFYNESSVPLIIVTTSFVAFLISILILKDKKRGSATQFNLMTTMLLGGLWHGASIRFIIWGTLHGLALAIHKAFVSLIPQGQNNWLSRILFTLLTFHFVAFCWIFFRSKDFHIAIDIINNIGNLELNWQQWRAILLGYKNVFLIMLIGYLWHFIPSKWIKQFRISFEKMPLLVQSLIIAIVFWIVFATASSGTQPFIYFQF
ncbi:MAG: MBOAT family O-acyltransferase [Bacteroidota bacterium]|nr:MBOAT family O-acyltransferase [Bacteroidota bacterium]